MKTDPGKLQLSGGLGISTTKTELGCNGEVKKADDSVKTNAGVGLFGNLSTGGAAGTSLFGGAASSSGASLFGSGFKFTPVSTTSTAANTAGGIFGGASLFGSAPASGGSLFGSSAGGGSLFSQTGSLFGG